MYETISQAKTPLLRRRIARRLQKFKFKLLVYVSIKGESLLDEAMQRAALVTFEQSPICLTGE